MLEHVFQIEGSAFVPIWQPIVALIEAWLTANPNDGDSIIDRHIAVCLLDDVVEHGGELGMQYFDDALRAQLAYADAEDNGVRQAALFGLGYARVGSCPLLTLPQRVGARGRRAVCAALATCP